MPTIEGRKTGQIHYVTADDWEKHFVAKGFDKRYRVLDDNDLAESIKPVPEIIETLEASTKYLSDLALENMSREEIKSQLEEKEIEFNKYAQTETLRELLKKHHGKGRTDERLDEDVK